MTWEEMKLIAKCSIFFNAALLTVLTVIGAVWLCRKLTPFGGLPVCPKCGLKYLHADCPAEPGEEGTR